MPVPQEVREKLVVLQDGLSAAGRVKLVSSENIHLTLRFLGEVSEQKAGEVSKTIESLVCEKKFRVSVSGLGVFPNTSRPRIVWAGVSEGSRELTALRERIDASLLQFGFRDEKRFHPHYTIARVRHLKDAGSFKGFIDANENTSFGSYVVDRVELMESVLSSAGPTYSRLKSVEFSQ